VEKGDSILVDRLREDEGDKVALRALLFADGDKAVFERTDLDKVKVEATVTGHERGKKVRVLKFKPKRGYKRRQGHRSELTRLQIGDIKLASTARKEPGVRSGDKSGSAGSARRSVKKEENGDGA
jgi:large subunit ribosomal protein L21